MKGIVSLKEMGEIFLSKNIELKSIYIFGKEFRNNNKNLIYKYENTTYRITQPIFKVGDIEMINIDFSFDWPENIKIEDLSHLFDGCFGLENVVMLKWPSNIKNISCMFRNCASLKSIVGLNGLDTTNVIDMSCVFENCQHLEKLDLSSWNTINVKDMKYLFSGCQSLRSLKGLDKWNTEAVKNMSYMFNDCPFLNPIGLGIYRWETPNVVEMRRMFFNCGTHTVSVPLNI